MIVGWLERFRRRRDAEIAEEIATHLAMATRDRIERGESAVHARLAAIREFGNVGLVADTTRRVWRWTTIEQLLQDLGFGVRILWHSPGLSASAILLVALVIGSNTTIFSMVQSVLTSPAAGVGADRLLAVKRLDPGATLAEPFFSYPIYRDFSARTTTLSGLVAWSDERLTVGIDSGTYALYGALVTTNYFDVLDVGIGAGRAFEVADSTLQNGLVAIVSDRLWRERLAATPGIVGQVIAVNGNPATIVGVAAPGFLGAINGPGEDLWVPLGAYYEAIAGASLLEDRSQPHVVMIGRLAPPSSMAQARAEIAALWAQLAAAHPTEIGKSRIITTEYSGAALLPIADMAPRFLALFSLVTLLTLLVVSANVANLMLGRAVERQRDTAVRQSLGASRLRIVRMLLCEGLAIAATAWAAASLMAWWTGRVLLRVLEPRPGLLAEARPDWTLAAYAMLLALLAALAFTTAPGIRAWRQQVLPLLKMGEHGVARGRSRASSALVILQFAFSVLLLTSASLALRSLSMLDSGDVGFDPDGLLLVTVRAGRTGAYVASEPSAADREARLVLLERVRERLTGVANVESVTYSRRVPGAYFLGTIPVARVGLAQRVQSFARPVGPDYLRALGLTPTAGRDLTAIDRRGAPRAAVVNRQLAAELWPEGSPIGQTLLVGEEREPAEIVGVAPDARFDGPVHDPHPRYVFLAEQQFSGPASIDPTFFVRHRGALEVVAPLVGRAIADVDADLPIVSMSTMMQRLEGVTILERQVSTLLIGFALISLVVATLGQYAVAMFNMRRRTRDFGVRLALGASAALIQRAVIGEALRLALIGLTIGFALSAAAGLAFRRVLFGVTPTDPPTYAGVFTLLALASIVASYFPAWRAGRISVIEALRQE